MDYGKFERLWNCAVCGEKVVYDSKEKTLSCKCGVVKNIDLPEESLRWNYTRISLEREHDEHDVTDDLPKHEENRHDYGTEKGEPPAE